MFRFNVLSQIECPICGNPAPSGEFIRIQDGDYERSFYRCLNEDCSANKAMTYNEFYSVVAGKYHIDRPDMRCREALEYDIRELLTIIQERDLKKEKWGNFMKTHLFSPELADSITETGKRLIRETQDFIEKSCTMLANQELFQTKRVYIESFNQLIELDPPALMADGPNDSNGYLERPTGGWRSYGDNGFTGIGYMGNQSEEFTGKWFPAKAGLGHIPTNGYG